MAEVTRAQRSPATAPGYRRGRVPGNKGLKLPAEALTPTEIRALFESFGTSRTDVRNRAIVTLMYRAGLKIGEIVNLERRHFEPGSETLALPATPRLVDREIRIDTGTRKALDRWMEVRRSLGVRATAPLFCTIAANADGNRLHTAYLREFLRDRALSLGIDRRVTAEGLRRSGTEHRARFHGSVEAWIGSYLDEERFGRCFPDAFEKWQSALDLFAIHPERHATRIGHECRDALQSFVDAALRANDVQPPRGSGTVSRLRMLIDHLGPQGSSVAAHCKALVTYWGTVSDLAQRQEHGAAREGQPLGAEDARRLIFHTMLVMFEVDQQLRPAERHGSPTVVAPAVKGA
jgi:hypothetical protein